MNHYVYEITNLINGKKYIGKRSCKCKVEDDKYMGSGKLLKKAFEKYGKENFRKDIIAICGTEQDAYEQEYILISVYKADEKAEFYNLSDGGKGFTSKQSKMLWRDERIRKIKSKQSKELWNDEEYRNKHIEYSRKQMKEMWKDEKYRKLFIQQSKARMSNERKNKQSEELKAKWKNKDYRNKMQEINKKPIILLNTLEIYKSAKDAYDKVGLKYPSAITDCCMGRLKSAGKVNKMRARWIYLDEFMTLAMQEIKNIYKEKTIHKASRKYICLNDKTVHVGSVASAIHVGLKSPSSINACCKGERKSAGKINGEPAKWMYYEDYLKINHNSNIEGNK